MITRKSNFFLTYTCRTNDNRLILTVLFREIKGQKTISRCKKSECRDMDIYSIFRAAQDRELTEGSDCRSSSVHSSENFSPCITSSGTRVISMICFPACLLVCAQFCFSVILHLRDGRTDGQTPRIQFGAF